MVAFPAEKRRVSGRIAREVLTNPVFEEFRFSLEIEQQVFKRRIIL